MALIHEFAASETSPANYAKTIINQAARSAFVNDLARRFWQLYLEHQDDTFFEIRIFGVQLVRKTWRDVLYRKFVQWFGEPPVLVPAPDEVAA